MSELTQEKLKLLVPLAIYRKIMAYVQICDLEISGFAELEYNEARNAFIVGEPYLLEQEVSGAATHMDEEDVSKFNLQYIKKGGTQLPRLWWHSHVDMQAFFSAIDEDTLKQLQNDTFIVALVLNKRKEWKAKAYLYSETDSNIMGIKFKTKEWIEIDPLPAEVELEYERIPEALKKEVDKKVKKQVHKITVYDKNGKGRTPYPSPLIWDGRGEKIKKYLQLPKDKTAAERKIDELGLIKEWDTDLRQYVYRDEQTGKIWFDYWDSLEAFDNENFLNDIDNEEEVEKIKEVYSK